MTPAGRRLYIVQSNPVVGREDAYDAWYADHLSRIVTLPGFVGAQRFRRSDVQRAERYSTYPYSHLAFYEIEGDPRLAFDTLDAAQRAGLPSAAGIVGEFVGHVFEPIGDRVDPPGAS